MPASFDLAVAGLGAMGSAVCCHAARRGLRVVGLDRFAPPHDRGSSHGESRIIREAYFEDPRYVPIVQRAYELWHQLERDTDARLFLRTGGLMIGPPGGALVAGARASADAHRLPHEVLDAGEVRRRFPALAPADGMAAVWEPRAGVLFPEACVRAHLEAAVRAGAELRTDTALLGWSADGEGVAVSTAGGEVRASRLVLAAGAWLGALVPELTPHLTVARQPLFWYEPVDRPHDFEPERLPIYIWEWTAGRYFYGFPAIGGEVKVAPHGEGEVTDPDRARRDVAPAEIAAMRDLLARFMPGAAGRSTRAVACLYTNTPDGHFVLDRHPAHPQVVIVSACSGHGFKFSSAIGEIVVGMALEEPARFDLDLFRWRFP
jgi:sarcosine oxidase